VALRRRWPPGRERNWDGQEVTLSYTGDRLSAVAGAYGYGFALAYDDAGRVAEVTAHDGRRVSYGYGPTGWLEKITDPAVRSPPTPTTRMGVCPRSPTPTAG
jgi:YD repeat-containing protein